MEHVASRQRGRCSGRGAKTLFLDSDRYREGASGQSVVAAEVAEERACSPQWWFVRVVPRYECLCGAVNILSSDYLCNGDIVRSCLC
jgi:hypothetical protein